jgi:hypothetical protein
VHGDLECLDHAMWSRCDLERFQISSLKESKSALLKFGRGNREPDGQDGLSQA